MHGNFWTWDREYRCVQMRADLDHVISYFSRVKWCASNGKHACGRVPVAQTFCHPPPFTYIIIAGPLPPRCIFEMFPVRCGCLDAASGIHLFVEKTCLVHRPFTCPSSQLGILPSPFSTGLTHCLKLEEELIAGIDHVCQSTNS